MRSKAKPGKAEDIGNVLPCCCAGSWPVLHELSRYLSCPEGNGNLVPWGSCRMRFLNSLLGSFVRVSGLLAPEIRRSQRQLRRVKP